MDAGNLISGSSSLIAQLVNSLPAVQETLVWFLGWENHWRRDWLPTPLFLGSPCGSADKESTCSAGDLGSIPGLGRSSGEGKGYPFQYSSLENFMDCIEAMGSQRVRHDWATFISSAFSKFSLNIWKFTVHILLKPSLENSPSQASFLSLLFSSYTCTDVLWWVLKGSSPQISSFLSLQFFLLWHSAL